MVIALRLDDGSESRLAADLRPAEKDVAIHALNTRFFYSRVKTDDRRPLSIVQNVFKLRRNGAEEFLRKRIETLKVKN